MPAAPTFSRVAFTATSLMAGVGAFVFDWNETHIYNPAWPGHAKFHNAQTMSMGAALALVTGGVAWWPGRWTRQRLDLAAGAASVYWATQLSASAYPGTTMLDDPPRRFGPQVVVASACLTLNAVAYAAGRRRHR
ncbi:MAG: DUF6640 family protein [Janthinobacterium lividum]